MEPRLSPRRFAAPWGTSVKVVSAGVTALLLGVLVLTLQSVPVGHPVARAIAIGVPLLILGGTGLFVVRGYWITDRVLNIRRLLWTTRIPLAGMESVTLDPAAMNGSLRLAGNGGLFAFTGLFRNKTLGSYRAFVTDPKRCVVIRLPRRPVVVSPDQPAEFASDLKRAAGLA